MRKFSFFLSAFLLFFKKMCYYFQNCRIGGSLTVLILINTIYKKVGGHPPFYEIERSQLWNKRNVVAVENLLDD